MAIVIALGLGLVMEVTGHTNSVTAVAHVSCGRKGRQLTILNVVSLLALPDNFWLSTFESFRIDH